MATSQPRGQQQPPGAPAIVYHVPVCSGTVPVARWAHASACCGPFLYVYGGVGPSVLDDLAVLDVELMVWRSLTPSAARPKDRPDKLHAAAMCAVGSTLWMFGGQQGRKHLRSLYSLSTDALTWKLVVPDGAQPAAREGHTFTAASGVAYLFGGQGKKLYSDLFVLQPGGTEWVELKPSGRVPSPRSGHSMVWDGADRLICFGGATATTTDNAMFVYSIRQNEWSVQQACGAIPSPRTRHSAVLLNPKAMLVFGGCNSAGVFFNDAYLLNLDTWTWTSMQPLNSPPAPRYHHSCHIAGGKVVLYGGVNPKQAFDAVVLLQTSSGCQELSAVADELARMTAGGIPQSSAAAAAAAASSGAAGLLGATSGAGGAGSMPLVGDLMKLQLRDLLMKRNMEELHITAQQKAEAVEVKLRQEQADKLALQKEVMQLKLIKEEAEESVKQLREQLSEANRALARETAEHQATSAVLSDLRSNLESREQQLAEARQLLDSMSAELGILASRLHRLQQERDALRAARQQDRLARRQQQQHALEQQQQQQQQHWPPSQLLQQQRSALTPCQAELLQPLTGAAAAAAQLQLLRHGQSLVSSVMAPSADAADDPSTADSQPFVDCVSISIESVPLQQQQQQQQQYEPMLPLGSSLQRLGSASAGATSRGSSPLCDDTDGSLLQGHMAVLDPSSDEPVPLCLHGHLDAACLLCMCQRFLEATAGSCTHLAPGSSIAQAAARLSGSGMSLPILSATTDTAAAASSSSAGVGTAAAAAGPSAAGLSTAAVAACASEAAQYRQYLSISELARNRLEAENAALQQQVQDLSAQVSAQQQELRVMQAQPAALTLCSIEELTALEGTLEASTKAVRQVVLQRSIAEYQRQASAETLRCAVCMEARRSLAFGCGHQTCDKCGDKITVCPFCRQAITAKIKLFE